MITLIRLQTLIEIPERNERFNRDYRNSRRFKSVPILNQLTEEQVAVFSVNQHNFRCRSHELKTFYPYGECSPM